MGITLLDTPGHVDFSAEMERTLQVLDYAVLVISGADGVQGHTETLWRLLGQYKIPVFLFVNKMDQAGTDRERVLAELKKRFGDHCIDFEKVFGSESSEEAAEQLAMCDEGLLEQYLENGELPREQVADLISQRRVFPCYFGSALHTEGVEELLDALESLTEERQYPAKFGAKVYKIGRDEQGNRLTYLKVTGGSIKVRRSSRIRRRRSIRSAAIPVQNMRCFQRYMQGKSVQLPGFLIRIRDRGWEQSRSLICRF